MPGRHILTLKCLDRPGIVHAVAAGVLARGGNIVESNQFRDPDTNIFCMRTVVQTDNGDSSELREAIHDQLDDRTAVLRVRPVEHRPRVLIMVSKFDHCSSICSTDGETECLRLRFR